jgi:DNA-directed RNA polymerase subunit RPC12/RpoP
MLILMDYLGLPEGQQEQIDVVTADLFGKADPREMPFYFFPDALHIEYSTAVRAEITVQDYSVAPRHWYIDATFHCADCKSEFVWSAEEQKVSFEVHRLAVMSRATRCRDCSGGKRDD